MKKIISFMALCVVLGGVAMTVIGCGNKPAKPAGSVWRVTENFSSGTWHKVLKDDSQQTYFCFHANGNLYQVEKNDDELTVTNWGAYSIDREKITLVNGSTKDKYKYTLKDGTLEVLGLNKRMEMVSSPSQDDIKKAVK